ncbi:response regulator [Nitrospira sp. Kam-Ns4a]
MASKILAVDDDAKWLRILSLYLQGRGYEVTTAQSGDEALRHVAAARPDLIIADIAMPGMDGYELCSRLRQDPQSRTIPFIFLTARDQDTDRIRARKLGSDDYVTKPCPLERLLQSVETVMDRVEQARRIPLDEIGQSGRLDDVDLLDLIQTLELEQKTGALILSHGERTGTLYFKDGLIVEANIQSPKRAEPLFILLGWKTGRFLFIPDAVPERMPITASMANLLVQDLLALERHERDGRSDGGRTGPPPANQPASLPGRVLACLEAVAERCRRERAVPAPLQIVRILVVGVTGTGSSELIHGVVKDLSGSRWAAVGTEEPTDDHRTDFGRVLVAPGTVVHLVAVRGEKRFWPVWEQYLPQAQAALLLVEPQDRAALGHLEAFLRARQTLAPGLPVHALLPVGSAHPDLPGLRAEDCSFGSLDDPVTRLSALDRMLQPYLAAG